MVQSNEEKNASDGMEPLNLRLQMSDDHESLSIHAELTDRLPLYNADATLNLSRDVADGFLILLSAGRKSARALRENKANNCNKQQKHSSHGNSKSESEGNDATAVPSAGGESTAQSPTDADDSIMQLSFAALTEGNVIEALFGVETTGGLRRGKNTSEQAYKAAKTAKSGLMGAAISSDSVQKLAVDTYCHCFEIVLTYYIELEDMGFISWCFRHQKARDKATVQLKEAFVQLEEVVAASTT